MRPPPVEVPGPLVWYVVFCDQPWLFWWQRALRRGFRHVFAFGYDGDRAAWLLVDPCASGLVVSALTADEVTAFIMAARTRNVRCLKVRRGDRRSSWPPLGPASCVTAIAKLVGAGGCALSPYGLWRRLRAAGAEEWPAPG